MQKRGCTGKEGQRTNGTSGEVQKIRILMSDLAGFLTNFFGCAGYQQLHQTCITENLFMLNVVQRMESSNKKLRKYNVGYKFLYTNSSLFTSLFRTSNNLLKIAVKTWMG